MPDMLYVQHAYTMQSRLYGKAYIVYIINSQDGVYLVVNITQEINAVLQIFMYL